VQLQIQTVSGRTLQPIPCLLGDTANEIIGKRDFELSRTPTQIELVLLSGKDLGFLPTGQPSLQEIYRRAEELGYALCPPEVGPQLRLQYTDQKVGEFLLVAMPGIRNYDGNETIFSVGNGGAGLALIGSSGKPDFRVPSTKFFVFMRGPWPKDGEVVRASGK
jgi:hypothetical protein